MCAVLRSCGPRGGVASSIMYIEIDARRALRRLKWVCVWCVCFGACVHKRYDQAQPSVYRLKVSGPASCHRAVAAANKSMNLHNMFAQRK